MANPSTKTNVADIINTLFQEQNNVMDFGSKLIQDKVQSDLVYRKAQIESDFNKQMNLLSQRGDYDNFEKDTNAFLNNYRTKLQKESRIPLEARYVDEMFLGYKNAMEQNVARLSMQKTANATVANYENAIKINSDTYAGQQAIDANLEPISRLQAQNMIEPGEAFNIRVSTAESSINKNNSLWIDNNVAQAVQSGMSEDDFIKASVEWSRAQPYQVMILDDAHASPEGLIEAIETGNGYVDISDRLDKKAIEQTCIDSGRKAYKKALGEYQDKNARFLADNYISQIENTADKGLQNEYKAAGRTALDYMINKNPQALSDPDYEKYLRAFAPQNEGGAAGSGNHEKNIKMIIEPLFEAMKNGRNSAIDGIENGSIFFAEIGNIIDRYGDKNNLSPNDREQLRTVVYGDYYDKVEKFYFNDQRTQKIWSQVKKFAKDNKDGRYSQSVLEDLMIEYSKDALKNVDVSNHEQLEAVANDILNYGYGLQFNALGEMTKGKEQSNRFIAENTDRKGEIKDPIATLANGVYALNFTDVKKDMIKAPVAYIGFREQEVINPNAWDAVQLIDKAAKNEIPKLFGEDVSVVANWKRDPKNRNEITGTRIYSVTTKDGESATIEFVPTDKGLLGGKHFNVLKNGEVITDDKKLAKMKAPKGEKPSIPMQSVQEAAEEAGYSNEKLTARNIAPAEPDTRGGKNKAPNTLDLTDAGLLKEIPEEKKEPIGEIIGVSGGKETKKPEEVKQTNSFTPKTFY